MKKNFMLVSMAFASATLSAQNVSQDTLQFEELQEITIQAVRATKETPVAQSTMDKKDIAKRNLGQDIPVLMSYLPSVVYTSDAGNGVGYTGIRVRGTDPTRVNVTLNGIPYNDSESQGTFWVNMPDFASSTQSLQLQRGVGTSTNGAGAFGASLNLQTDFFSYEPSGELSTSIGSFNTRKHTLKYSTGLMNNAVELQGRVSQIFSDGYVDRASSKLQSYFLQGTFVTGGTLLKALTFGGKEKTYQTWDGVTANDIKNFGRTHNNGGMYTDKNGNIKYYDNHTDNYKQDHYQVHWNQKWQPNWQTNVALHYTKGFGYYESFRDDRKLSKVGIDPFTDAAGNTIKESDLIDRKYLDNNFYGLTFSSNYSFEQSALTVGGAANAYEGKHFGEIIWIEEPVAYNYQQRYYDNDARKTDANVFAKYNLSIDQWQFYVDLQYRTIHYKANSEDTGNVNDDFDFFNPKAGLTYVVSPVQNMYFSYAQANREPSRSDYENGNPKPERLHDFELGWRYDDANYLFNVNLYYMKYQDQLVLTGALDDVGAPIRTNSGDSYRAGVEVEAHIPIGKRFQWQPAITYSQNKNRNFFTERDGALVDLGDTQISYSPNIIASNIFSYRITKGLEIGLLSKYVGEQFMSNTENEESKLDDYLVHNIIVGYDIQPKRFAKNIRLSLMLNNILNEEYSNNGYYYTYDDDWSNPGTIETIDNTYYYPQAKFNFFLGATISF